MGQWNAEFGTLGTRIEHVYTFTIFHSVFLQLLGHKPQACGSCRGPWFEVIGYFEPIPEEEHSDKANELKLDSVC